MNEDIEENSENTEYSVTDEISIETVEETNDLITASVYDTYQQEILNTLDDINENLNTVIINQNTIISYSESSYKFTGTTIILVTIIFIYLFLKDTLHINRGS